MSRVTKCEPAEESREAARGGNQLIDLRRVIDSCDVINMWIDVQAHLK